MKMLDSDQRRHFVTIQGDRCYSFNLRNRQRSIVVRINIGQNILTEPGIRESRLNINRNIPLRIQGNTLVNHIAIHTKYKSIGQFGICIPAVQFHSLICGILRHHDRISLKCIHIGDIASPTTIKGYPAIRQGRGCDHDRSRIHAKTPTLIRIRPFKCNPFACSLEVPAS